MRRWWTALLAFFSRNAATTVQDHQDTAFREMVDAAQRRAVEQTARAFLIRKQVENMLRAGGWKKGD